MKGLEFIEDTMDSESDLRSQNNFTDAFIEVPRPVLYKENLTPQNLNSPTFEAVLQQNEDLMNRLKVAMLRLNQLETANTQYNLENNKLKLQNQSLMSRYAVHKEEVDEFKADLKHLELERDKAFEIKNIIEKKNQDLLTTVEQFEIYKEKIATEVKPYITELKTENIQLKEEVKTFKQSQKTYLEQIDQLRNHIIEVTQNYSQENAFAKNSYETNLLNLQEQLLFLKQEHNEKIEHIKDLELRLQKSQHRTEYLDEVENSLVQEKRDHEFARLNLGSEINRLQTKLHDGQLQLTSLNSNVERLKLENETLSRRNEEMDRDLLNSHEQMEALRNLYSKKSQELEKIQKSNEALERLNLELSKSI